MRAVRVIRAVKKMIVNKHIIQGKLILAVCDSDLLGEKIEDSNLMLDLGSEFYNGDNLSRDEFLSLIKKTYIINAVGKEVIKLLITKKIVSKNQVRFLNSVPYVQIVFEMN